MYPEWALLLATQSQGASFAKAASVKAAQEMDMVKDPEDIDLKESMDKLKM